MHVSVCSCVYICLQSECLDLCFVLCAVSVFATFSLLVSSCFSTVFVVCQSICLPAP